MDPIGWWQNERMQAFGALVATPAAMDIRRKEAAKLPTPLALLLLALVGHGKAPRTGYTCPLRVSGAARCTTLALPSRLASVRDYNLPLVTGPMRVACATVRGTLETPTSTPRLWLAPCCQPTDGLVPPPTVTRATLPCMEFEGGLIQARSRLGRAGSPRRLLEAIRIQFEGMLCLGRLTAAARPGCLERWLALPLNTLLFVDPSMITRSASRRRRDARRPRSSRRLLTALLRSALAFLPGPPLPRPATGPLVPTPPPSPRTTAWRPTPPTDVG